MKDLNYQIVGEGSVVTSSAPHAGTEVAEGSTIIVYVTKGENDNNMTQTPSVLGRSYDEAVQIIMDAGLSAVVEGDENGVVVSQNPIKGEYVVKGSDITLQFEVKDGGAAGGSSGGTQSETGQPANGHNGDSSDTSASDTQNAVPVTKRKTGKVVS